MVCLPQILLGLLQRRYTAQMMASGPGPNNRYVVVSGPGIQPVRLDPQDWTLIHNAILKDREEDTDGAVDTSAPSVPDKLQPYRMGAFLPPKKATQSPHRFNPRTPINQALLRDSGRFEAVIVEVLKGLFPR